MAFSLNYLYEDGVFSELGELQPGVCLLPQQDEGGVPLPHQAQYLA